MFLRIRDACVSDLEDIKRIEDRSFKNPYSRDLLLFFLNTCDIFIVAVLHDVVFEREKIVGYLCGELETRKNVKVGHIISIAVDPAYRRRKIGSSLMKESLGRFRRMGARWVYLECRVSNATAQKFYEKLGFRKVEIISGYYENGEDALIYKKDL